jgi:peptidoglycan/xylan/chitin deacetylase (PgdA/CDA1 family)
VKQLARRALKVSARAADRLRPPAPGVVILCYHRVGAGSGLQLDLDRGRFEDQMAALAGAGGAVPLDRALDALRDPDPSAGTSVRVVVTFDDGTADFADTALPILERCSIPVTLYVATAFVDEQRPFPYGAPPLSWQALRDATATGLVTVGSHTHTHALLDRVPEAVVVDELDTSVRLIGEHVGVRPRHFAYPKSVAGSKAADAAVRARFASAALAGTRANDYGRTDPYRLARSPVQATDDMDVVAAKARGGMWLEDDVRRAVNRFRYARATS